MGGQPLISRGVVEPDGEIGGRLAGIPQIDGKTGAVLGKPRRGTDPGPVPGALVALRLDIKKQLTLQGDGAEGAEHHQIDAIGPGGLLHRQQGLGRSGLQPQIGTDGHQLALRQLRVREMAQQSTISAEPGIEPGDRSWR